MYTLTIPRITLYSSCLLSKRSYRRSKAIAALIIQYKLRVTLFTVPQRVDASPGNQLFWAGHGLSANVKVTFSASRHESKRARFRAYTDKARRGRPYTGQISVSKLPPRRTDAKGLCRRHSSLPERTERYLQLRSRLLKL